MSRDLTQAEKEGLESLIDRASLQSVLMGLSEICDEKSEHILASYSDKPLAKLWASACGVLGIASVERNVSAISI